MQQRGEKRRKKKLNFCFGPACLHTEQERKSYGERERVRRIQAHKGEIALEVLERSSAMYLFIKKEICSSWIITNVLYSLSLSLSRTPHHTTVKMSETMRDRDINRYLYVLKRAATTISSSTSLRSNLLILPLPHHPRSLSSSTSHLVYIQHMLFPLQKQKPNVLIKFS